MPGTSLFDATRAAFPGFSPLQVCVLHASLVAPNCAGSAGQLRESLGLPAVVQVNNALGQAGRSVFMLLGRHPDGVSEGAFGWWSVLATGMRGRGRFVWTLRSEVVAALKACGLRELDSPTVDAADSTGALTEGTVRQVWANTYARSLEARAQCIAFYGPHCVACGVNFGERYGPIADGFIHVHHLRQLSVLGQEYKVDPIQDLRPVCPNCHAVIHMVDPPHTIEQVQALLARSSTDGVIPSRSA